MALKNLGVTEGTSDTEIVHAKFVIGCDGKLELTTFINNGLTFVLYPRCAFMDKKTVRYHHGRRANRSVTYPEVRGTPL